MDWIKKIFGLRRISDSQACEEAKQEVITIDLLGLQAKVDGVPTYDLFETGKHDLEAMLRVCESEELSYWGQPAGGRMCAAPAAFLRVAILSKKAKNLDQELFICRRWKRIAEDYASQLPVIRGEWAQAHRGGSSRKILERLAKIEASAERR